MSIELAAVIANLPASTNGGRFLGISPGGGLIRDDAARNDIATNLQMIGNLAITTNQQIAAAIQAAHNELVGADGATNTRITQIQTATNQTIAGLFTTNQTEHLAIIDQFRAGDAFEAKNREDADKLLAKRSDQIEKDTDTARSDILKKLGYDNVTMEDRPGIILGGVYYPIVFCYSDGWAFAGLTLNMELIKFNNSGDFYEKMTRQSYNGKEYELLISEQGDGSSAAWVFGGITSDGQIIVEYPITYPGSQMFKEFPDVAHMIQLGQSNNQGAQSQPIVTKTDPGFGAYKFTRGVVTRLDGNNPGNPAARPASDFNFVKLLPAVQEDFTGETIAIGRTSKFRATGGGGRFAATDFTNLVPHLLASYPNRGGKHLCELDQRDYETNPGNPNPGVGGYFATFIDDIYRARQKAISLSLTYAPIALNFCQGENEGAGYRIPGQPFETFAVFVPAYKNDLYTAYLNWNSVARQVVPEMKRDMMMTITQVCTQWAGESQRQLADESPNIFLATPFYQVPSALNAVWLNDQHGAAVHITADGQRWVGELVGKVERKILQEGVNWRPTTPNTIKRIDNRTIRINYNVPAKPLRLVTDFLPKLKDFGFVVTLGTPDAPQAAYGINAVTLDPNGTDIVLTLASDLPVGFNAFITYGMQALTQDGIITGPTGTQAGPARAVGTGSFPTTEFIFAGDLRAKVSPLLQEGCFYLRQYTSGVPNAVIRSIRYDAGTNRSFLLSETREVSAAFTMNTVVSLERDRPGGNVADSDNEQSIFNFDDNSYGNRFGKPYPLNNFSTIFQTQIDTSV